MAASLVIALVLIRSFAFGASECGSVYSNEPGIKKVPTSKSANFKGFEKSLRRFKEVVANLPNELPSIPSERGKYYMVESLGIDHETGAIIDPDFRTIAKVIGLNQRLKTYMKEGTVPRDPEKSFYSVFGDFDLVSARHSVSFGKNEKIYYPEDFAHFPEQFRPNKPFRFKEVLGFSRVENKNTTSERDAGRALFKTPEFKDFSVLEISRMDVATRNPIDSLQHITHALNSIFKYSNQTDPAKIMVVCSVYDVAHFKLWSSWGFTPVPSLQKVPIKIGGTMDIMSITGDKLREVLDRKNKELFALEVERAARHMEKSNQKIDEDLSGYLNGKVFFSQRISSTSELVVKIEKTSEDQLVLIPYLEYSSGQVVRGQVIVSQNRRHGAGVDLGIDVIGLELETRFADGPIKQYKAKVFYPVLTGAHYHMQTSTFGSNGHRSEEAGSFYGTVSPQSNRIAFHYEDVPTDRREPLRKENKTVVLAGWERILREENWMVPLNENILPPILLSRVTAYPQGKSFAEWLKPSIEINGRAYTGAARSGRSFENISGRGMLYEKDISPDSLLNLEIFYPQGLPSMARTDALKYDIANSKLSPMGIPAPSPLQLVHYWARFYGQYPIEKILSAVGVK